MVNSKSRAKSNPRASNPHLTRLRNLIFIIIFVVTAIIITTVVCANLSKPENQVPSRISTLANNYYENVFYENLVNSHKYPGSPEPALSRYTEYGLSPIALRQLLLEDQISTPDDAAYLLEYCDENRTSVKFFPEPPYSRTDYRVEYTYSCNY